MDNLREELKRRTNDIHRELEHATFPHNDFHHAHNYLVHLSAMHSARAVFLEAPSRGGGDYHVDGAYNDEAIGLLERDLHSLGTPVRVKTYSGAAVHVLGASYVIEGSAMGARILAKHLPPHFPREYITFMVGRSVAQWKRVLLALEDDSDSSAIIDGALRVFEYLREYGTWRRHEFTEVT